MIKTSGGLHVNTLYSRPVLMKLEFSLAGFRKILKLPNFMKFRLVGAKSFHVYRRMDRHDEANSRFSQFRECV
jgi:hypothetical protein